MKKIALDWQVSWLDGEGKSGEWMTATVPGAVQLDYAKAHGWEPFCKGQDTNAYKWMEDVFWVYSAPLAFSLADGQRATLVLTAVDYRCEVRVDGKTLARKEGMFTPVVVDVSEYADTNATVEVMIYPVPKADDSDSRDQARKSCKSAACYGWDWHPRLVSSGIWDEAYLKIEDQRAVTGLDVSYRLSDDLGVCVLTAIARTTAERATFTLDFEGTTVACATICAQEGVAEWEVLVQNPKLWNPVGYGEQYLYELTVSPAGAEESFCRTVGFRRSKMVMNEGSWEQPSVFPKSRSDAPATIELNGVRVFAKGSNWVNAEVFPSEMTAQKYEKLLTLVRDCNMNMLRVWGGGFVNKESFYDLCDKLGIMVWQEFPLACNEYPDEDGYLGVLEVEAEAIVRRLRSHPCVVLWCGGNELFNSWSKMTDQHHALRLLNAVCYREDRYTPFIATSPLMGMAHGHYVNYDEETGREFYCDLLGAHNTAYTEFGCPGMASAAYLQELLGQENFDDCSPSNPYWVFHHGFGAWMDNTWVRLPEVDYYFGGYENMQDVCEKSAFIQAMCYKAMFEEMRKQAPHCSMALNWCFNEPWQTVSNNSLISYPDVVKPAYYAVRDALRPFMASVRTEKLSFTGGETLKAEIWMLNDSLSNGKAGEVTVFALCREKCKELGTFRYGEVAKQTNVMLGSVAFAIPRDYEGGVKLMLAVKGNEQASSVYEYWCKSREQREPSRPILNR